MSTNNQEQAPLPQRKSLRLAGRVPANPGVAEPQRIGRKVSAAKGHIDLPEQERDSSAGMSTLSPVKKRPADGSPDVSPDADQLVLSSPPKKPSKIPDSVKLKHEVIDLTGDDSDEEKPRTGVARNLSGSFKVGEPAPLVQGAPYGRKIVEVPDPHPWEEDVKPPPAEDAFVLRTAREVSQRFAIIVHDVEYQQKAEALKFFQQVNEDRSRLLVLKNPVL
ncbi:hypothetical protein H310_14778 [Aphanomyces invadans]|uniref:Uncharacterized protein n=1 Tax=Aphanomyces invadans TaxID=157072 RepID=A0A024T8K9_9STRA|nr:hypothetical protein H310_14778 [Aphanomyces invadans]ETV90455.1 hypothetical protein H310_14778 [Aphanomyces invadans]|eukprot:XP_008880929.1 hypothetical protein H310_14778 [Aphanomyces invadans]